MTDEVIDDDEVQLPPADLDAEAAVLGAVFLDEGTIGRVRDFLRPEHFFSEAHRRIWEAVLVVDHEPRETAQRSCIVRVGSRLKATNRLKQVGGMAYLTELLNATPSTSNVAKYAEIIHGRWRVRQTIVTCQRIVAHGYLDASSNVQSYVDSAHVELARIAADNPMSPVPTNEQSIGRVVRQVSIDDPDRTSTMQGYPTGLHTLDRHLGGLAAGHKFTLVATSGIGKTAFAGQVAVHVAKLGVGVMMFSTEVQREEVLFRALSNESAVESARMKRAPREPLTRDELGRLCTAADSLKRLPWVIDETPSITPEEVRAKVASQIDSMRIVNRVPLGLVIVDYVQRLAPSKHLQWRQKHEQVEHATRTLKQLAQEHRLTVLEIAQAKAYEKNKKPNLDTGISDSKAIKNEADEVMFLVPQGKLDNGAYDVTAYVAKQRGGAKAIEVDLEYHGALYRFLDPNDPLRPASRDFLAGAS